MLTLNKDVLHIDWPFGVKENFTLTDDGQVGGVDSALARGDLHARELLGDQRRRLACNMHDGLVGSRGVCQKLLACGMKEIAYYV